MAFNVFVSHSMRQEDLEIVYEASRQARISGIHCYIAERDFQYGETLSEKIENAIRACDMFIAFWTDGGAHSAFVNQEIGFAKANGKHRILIVEIGIEVKGFDIGKEYLELDRSHPENAIKLLTNHLTKLALLKASKELTEQRNTVLFVLGVLTLLFIVSID
jgi:hypothetical protein